VAALAALLLAVAPAQETLDWPWWRGPAHDGISRETGWRSEGAAEPLWTVEVGLGHSSSAIVDGRLYTLGFDEARGLDQVWCLDVATGEPQWQVTWPAERDANGHGGGTHTTPTVVAGTVYVSERRGTVRALAAADGEELWKRDLCVEEGVKSRDYGFGGSPLVVDDRLVIDAASVLTLDRETGETLWKTGDVGAYYSTPTPWTLAGESVSASFTRQGLYLFTLASGEERGHFPWEKGSVRVNAASPVVVDESHLMISSGYGHGAALVDFSGAVPAAVWETKGLKTQLMTCVLLPAADGQRYLYGFDEATLKCFDLEGKERWRKRGLGQGALMASDGRLIVLGGKGELVIARADPGGYEELSRRRVLDGSVFWSVPVLHGGRILCRSGDGRLVCRDHRAP
jgi:outer membrane protein assembly factor BamB